MDSDPRSGPVPLYHRLYLVLRQQIEEGRFRSNEPLPGEIELSRQHGISRITVRRTMEMLTSEGLIERRRGRGTFVRMGALGTPIAGQLSGLADNLSSYARFTSVTVHSFKEVPASPTVAAALAIEIGAPVQKAIRTRSRDGVPVSLLTTHVPEALGRTYTREELAAGSLIRLLERGGAQVDAAESAITAKLADAVSAPLLDVQVGRPLIALTRLVRDPAGRPIELLSALYRPDQYEVRLSLSRRERESADLWSYRAEGGEGEAPE